MSEPPSLTADELLADVRWLRRFARMLAARRWNDDLRRRGHEAERAREVGRAARAAETSDVERLQLQHRLVGCVLRLDEPYRTAIVLRYHRELSYGDLARRLRIAEPAARKRASRGLALLRERLEHEAGGDWRESFSVLTAAPFGGSPPHAPWIAGGAAAAVALAGLGLWRFRASSTPTPWSPAAPEGRVGPGSDEARAAFGGRYSSALVQTIGR